MGDCRDGRNYCGWNVYELLVPRSSGLDSRFDCHAYSEAANLVSVKSFGEFEFWFALIKIVTIVLMIIAGFGLIFFGFGNGGVAIGLSNLWSHGGFFTGGFKGFFFALSLVVAAYQGVELVGITAGEAKDPKNTLTKAINSLIGRILIFYIGAIFVIVTVYPWDQLTAHWQPIRSYFCKSGYNSSGWNY